MQNKIPSEPARKYLRTVRDHLSCGFRQKREISARLTHTLLQFLDDHPDPTQEDLYEAFGSPEEFVRDSLPDLPQTRSKSRLHRCKPYLLAFCSVLLCVLAVFCIRNIYLSRQLQEQTAEDLGGYDDVQLIQSKADVDSLPPQEQNQWKYGLNYDIVSGKIVSARDKNGTVVEVDSNGKPTDENYPVCAFYDNLPEK